MNRLPDGYFERIYASDHDPWGFESAWYEQRKYAMTVAALPQKHYARAFEPGCSHGVLSALLAPRCDALIAYEPVAAIAERARRRLAEFPHVRVETAAIPDRWPGGAFDLVVLSEVAYYLTDDGMSELLAKLHGCLSSGGSVVAVHYRRETDYPMTGDAVHERLRAAAWLTSFGRYTEDAFELQAFVRGAP